MDTKLITQWFSETLVITSLPITRRRILYVNKCSGKNSNDQMKEAENTTNTEISYFPTN